MEFSRALDQIGSRLPKSTGGARSTERPNVSTSTESFSIRNFGSLGPCSYPRLCEAHLLRLHSKAEMLRVILSQQHRAQERGANPMRSENRLFDPLQDASRERSTYVRRKEDYVMT